MRYETLDARWAREPFGEDEAPRPPFVERHPAQDTGHALCGPIAIQGAEPGMTLEVRIDKIVPGSYGWTVAAGWESSVNRRLGMVEATHVIHRWTLDVESMTGTNQHGHQVALRPFLGVMGMPLDEPGIHSTAPPRSTGGNMDCKELVEGSTLYLPIAVAGGLFSTGDGHAVQGDGEVSCTAIECPMKEVELTFTLHPDLHLKNPRALTPAGWVTLGFDVDLDEAMFQAVEGMLDLLCTRYVLSRPDALALASLVVDLRVTQIVNGVSGVHAILPHGAIRNIEER